MNTLAKQLINEDLEQIPKEEQVWHFVSEIIGDGESSILCTGEYVDFGCGEGSYEMKKLRRGGITCDACLEIIRGIKSVRL